MCIFWSNTKSFIFPARFLLQFDLQSHAITEDYLIDNLFFCWLRSNDDDFDHCGTFKKKLYLLIV